jgi:hypothetical protein
MYMYKSNHKQIQLQLDPIYGLKSSLMIKNPNYLLRFYKHNPLFFQKQELCNGYDLINHKFQYIIE